MPVIRCMGVHDSFQVPGHIPLVTGPSRMVAKSVGYRAISRSVNGTTVGESTV